MFIHSFLERRREGERERNINVWLPLMRPLLGIPPVTQACALTGSGTRDPLVGGAGTQSTEPHQPGCIFYGFNINVQKKGCSPPLWKWRRWGRRGEHFGCWTVAAYQQPDCPLLGKEEK